ncbi:hypothetical protein QTP88_007776 [Uroleucon formosanum]
MRAHRHYIIQRYPNGKHNNTFLRWFWPFGTFWFESSRRRLSTVARGVFDNQHRTVVGHSGTRRGPTGNRELPGGPFPYFGIGALFRRLTVERKDS